VSAELRKIASLLLELRIICKRRRQSEIEAFFRSFAGSQQAEGPGGKRLIKPML
jgi:hypothetical protein